MEFFSSVAKRTRAQTDRFFEDRYREMKQNDGESITPRPVKKESKKGRKESGRKRRDSSGSVPDFIMLDTVDRNRVVNEEVGGDGPDFGEGPSRVAPRRNSLELDSGEKDDFDSFETKLFRDLGKKLKKKGVKEPKSGLKTRFQVQLDDEDDGLAATASDNGGFDGFRGRESVLEEEVKNSESVFEEIIRNDDSSSSEARLSSSSSSGTDDDDSQDEDFQIGITESCESLVQANSDEDEFEPEEKDLTVENSPSKTSEKVVEKEDQNHGENGSVKAEIGVVLPETTVSELGRGENEEKVPSFDRGEDIENGVQCCASNDAGVEDNTEILEEEVESRKLDDKKEGSKVDEKTPDDDVDVENHDYGENCSVGSVTGKMKAVSPEPPSSPVKNPTAESVVKGNMENENAARDDKRANFPLEIKPGMKSRERKRGNWSCRTSQAVYQKCGGDNGSVVADNDAKKLSELLPNAIIDAKKKCGDDNDSIATDNDAKKRSPLANEPTLQEDKGATFPLEIEVVMKSRARKKGNLEAGKEPRRNSQEENQKCDVDNVAENDAEKKMQQLKSSDASGHLLKGIFEKGKESAKTPLADEPILPLKFFFGVEEPELVEKSDYELELDNLFAELDLSLQFEDIGSVLPLDEVDDSSNEDHCSKGAHRLFLDDEIGMRCRICSYVEMEIKYHVPPVTKYISIASGKRIPLDEEPEEEDFNILEGFEFPNNTRESGNISNRSKGTVWDIIPGIKDTMYEHQQDGFEFIWKNLEGTLNLRDLKISNSNNIGGCIISHAPGTGKTRLTIVFLQSYLELFPVSRPVIIAPASMLLTWEEEFKKWDLGVPFHNLNNLLELNGKLVRNADLHRITKLKQWTNEKSILGISYSLYEKFVGEKIAKSDKDNKTGKWAKEETEALRKILLELPGVVVLDEGHTPRNERSRIWKALTRVETKRRIILSGTPFQNNFGELYNILCLVRPEFADQIPSRLKKFCHTKSKRKRGGGENEKTPEREATTDKNADMAIDELKGMIAPFVHLHKGSILQLSLPGLKDCMVVLNPVSELQKRLVTNIQCPANTFEFEHVLALSTVHPSLLLQTPHYKDLSNELEKIRLDPNEGSKTRFLMELVRLSVAMNEKVLVFSQYIDPLNLIKDQLASVFNWTEGKEMLQMQGRLDQGLRQTMINIFNNPNNKTRIMLASTKACSEGISLVGASRVVLLDVVWNPSVERQAISRAYRLGQKKVVYTYHLIMSGTAEWDKYCKQAEKDRLSELVFSERDRDNEKQKASLELSEDRILDEMISHVKLKDMFERIIYQPKEIKLIETFT